MADGGRRVVWSSERHAIVEDGPRLEFSRRLFSDLWIVIPAHLFFGGATVGGFFGPRPFLGLLMLPFYILMCFRLRPDPLGIGAVRPLACLDRRLGVMDLGMAPVARLDEIRASLVHEGSIDAIEIDGPDIHVRIVEMPAGTSDRLVIELRSLGVPLPGVVDAYRAATETRSAS